MAGEGRFHEHGETGRGSHPDEDAWERLAMNESLPDERKRTLEHASRCASCGRELRAILALERGAREIDPTLPAVLTSPGEAGRRRYWIGGSLAAAAAVGLVAFGLAAIRTEAPTVGQPPVRTMEDGRPQPTSPVGALDRRPESFEWTAAEEGRVYQVELLDEAGEVLWTSPEISGTNASWPSDIVPAPGRYYWRVFVLDTDTGATTIASPLVAFDLAD